MRIFHEDFPEYHLRMQELIKQFMYWMSQDECGLTLVPKE